jgi:hypothetical protein
MRRQLLDRLGGSKLIVFTPLLIFLTFITFFSFTANANECVDISIQNESACYGETVTLKPHITYKGYAKYVESYRGNLCYVSEALGKPDNCGTYFAKGSSSTYTRAIWQMPCKMPSGSELCLRVYVNSSSGSAKYNVWGVNKDAHGNKTYTLISTQQHSGKYWQQRCLTLQDDYEYVKIEDEGGKPFYVDAISYSLEDCDVSYSWSDGTNTLNNTVTVTKSETLTFTATLCDVSYSETVHITLDENCITPPSTSNCASGNYSWDANVQVNGTSVSTDLRFIDGQTTRYKLPNLPSEFGGAVKIAVTDAVSWDGYSNRAGTSAQLFEKWKVVFIKNGSVAYETPYTNDLTDGVISAEWRGSLGVETTFANGVDDIYLVHYEDDVYGTGSASSANSVVPSSVCLSYETITVGEYCGSKEVCIKANKVEANLTDYPLYFSYSDNDLKTVSKGGDVTNANGYDIAFTASNGDALDFELVSYNGDAGEIVAFVRLPHVSKTDNTCFNLVYGNEDITSDQSKSGTWNNNYKSIHHFEDLHDATRFNNDGTSYGGASLINGKLGKGLDLDGHNDYVDISGGSSLDISGKKVTISAWVCIPGNQSEDAPVVVRGSGVNKESYMLGFDSGKNPPKINTRVTTTNGHYRDDEGTVSASTWSLLTFVYDGNLSSNQKKTYVNGSLVADQNASGNIIGGNFKTWIGRRIDENRYLKGKIDELRISDNALSQDWIKTEYNNQSSPSTFYTVTDKTNCGEDEDEPVCTRGVANTKGCASTPYILYLVDNNGAHYLSGDNYEWNEFDNNDVRLTATGLTASGLTGTYDIDITFSDYTTTAPTNSPKTSNCFTTGNTSNWVYWETTSGIIESSTYGTLTVSRTGPAMQMGEGANITEDGFGASGWLSLSGTNNPFTSGDINVMLSPCGLVPPKPSNCEGSNVYSWSANVKVDEENVSSDVRFVDGRTTKYKLPNLPAAFASKVTISVSEAVSWDGYVNRSTVSQPNEQWKVVFLKDGNVLYETPYTQDLEDNVVSAQFVGSLGVPTTFTNGVDEVYLVHYEDNVYGTGSASSANSVVPSSVCLEYATDAQNIITGTVYEDLNGDANLDANEPGEPGVTVYLYQDENHNGILDANETTPIDSMVSNSSGEYEFIRDYACQNGYISRIEFSSGIDDKNNLIGEPDANFASYDQDVDELIVELDGTIEDGETYQVFLGTIEDGAYAIISESPDGVNFYYNTSVEILTSGNQAYTVVADTTTKFIKFDKNDIDQVDGYNSFGQTNTNIKDYKIFGIEFCNDPRDSYIINVDENDVPENNSLTTDNIETAQFTSGGNADENNDFGFIGPNNIITGTVFTDLNRDTIYEQSFEPGISQVTVSLFDDANSNGQIDANETLLQTQDVGPNGFYRFNVPYECDDEIVTRRVQSGNDDAEEFSDGEMYLNSTDLELVTGDGENQTIGIRFTDLDIPQGATITSATVQFTVDETGGSNGNLTIKGEKVLNSLSFNSTDNNITNRPLTSAGVTWNPDAAAWDVAGEATTDQRTPDLSTIIQEIVNQSSWQANNALSLIISGSGERVAESFNGDASSAPLLTVSYKQSSCTKSYIVVSDQNDVPGELDYTTDNLETASFSSAGNTDAQNDFGAAPIGNVITGTVFRDLNSDTLLSANEPGTEGVTVRLYADENDNGVLDASEITPVETTQTNSNGFYSFTRPYECVLGYASAIEFEEGISDANNLLGEPGSDFATYDMNDDNLIVELEGTINDGDEYEIYLGAIEAGAFAIISESSDGVNFYFNQSIEITSENSEAYTITADRDVKFIKFDKNNIDNVSGYNVFGQTTTNINDYKVYGVAFCNDPADSYIIDIDVNELPEDSELTTDNKETASFTSGGNTDPNNDFGWNLTARDFGDLPIDFGAEVVSAANTFNENLFLGANWDAETESNASTNADGDDNSGSSSDDEDGFLNPEVLVEPDELVTFRFTVTNNTGEDAYLQFSVDVDDSKSFEEDETAEVTVQSTESGSQTVEVSLLIPNDASINQVVYSRVRLSKQQGAGLTGLQEGGEIEDYRVITPVPVELISFTGELYNKNDVLLQWATAMELNNDRFEVERRYENETEFTQIGTVDGNGTSNEVFNYHYIDTKVNWNSTVVYYRLRQVDYDGLYAYTNIVAVSKESLLDATVYPNPTKYRATITFATDNRSTATLKVMDMFGKDVTTDVAIKNLTGAFEIDTRGLRNGTYYVQLTVGKEVLTKKLTVTR